MTDLASAAIGRSVGQPQRTLRALALGFLLAADYTVLIYV